jgi:crotonobetainyl-CoA:carnitine CoA-transferase CaiB-like acyl-CoA transferase
MSLQDARGLAGIRVVELGQMVAVPWAAKLLADLGADVIKVEPPGGDRSRSRGPFAGAPDPDASGLFVYLNTNKRSMVADLSVAADRERVARLLADADLLLHDLSPAAVAEWGLDAGSLRSTHPGLVTVSVTPFGQTGPYSGYRAEEIQTVHGGGWGWLTPGCSDRPDLPPLKPFGHQADFQAGFGAATAAMAAVDRAQRTGVGDHLDFSAMAHVTGMLEAGFITWSYLREIPGRLGARVLNPWRIFPAADGEIFVVCVEQDQWMRLKELMGSPEWADMEIFDTVEGRFDAEDLLHMWLGEWIEPQKVMDLFHLGQSNRVAFAPVFTMAQMAEDPHLAARGFLREIDQPGLGPVRVPGPPSRLTNPWWSIRRPAPRLGEHDDARFEGPIAPRPVPTAHSAARPLEGVTVADFSWVWAGPYCGMQLAHLGADVIKIESAQAPDLGRRLPLHSIDHDPTPDTNAYFNQWNQGKRSVTVDLGSEQGRALAKRLALDCDLVLSNYATGVMDRFGLGYEQLREERPDVIVATISGYGHVGPYKNYIGYGPTTAPLSGLASLTGYEGGPPEEVGVALGDPASGIATAFALVAALAARRRTGEGQYIDTSLWEATTACVGEGWMQWALTGAQPERMGNHDPLMAPHSLYPCAGDDQWVAIACADDAEWEALAEVVGLAGDDRFATAEARKANEAALDEHLGAWTTSRDRWEITGQLQAVGVPAFPCLDARSLDEDPHLAARGVIERLAHPVVGQKSHVGVPWISHDGPNGVPAPAPLLGADTDSVLSDMLGLTDAEIAELREAGVLR